MGEVGRDQQSFISIHDVLVAKRRDDLVVKYADAIIYCMTMNEPVYWQSVNDAIIAKWSVSGLNWIKRRAWERVDTV